MRKFLLFLLTLSFLPVAVLAQITSLNLTIQPDGHGGWREVVKNRGSSSVVAMRTTFRRRPGTQGGGVNTAVEVVYDSVTNYGIAPIIPLAASGTISPKTHPSFRAGWMS
jgi:hypothetical protein